MIPADLTAKMSFTLSDGTTLNICKEDCKMIAHLIMAEAMADGRKISIYRTVDTNAAKARELIKFLGEAKDIDEETRKKYHETIMYLMSNEGQEEHTEVEKLGGR